MDCGCVSGSWKKRISGETISEPITAPNKDNVTILHHYTFMHFKNK
jgi:hypothetical protein